jgi:SPP1 gp7 family putative phage head morphogenesis protein
MSNYWTARFEEQHKLLFDLTFDETMNILEKYYIKALEETKADALNLYAYLLEHSKDGTLIASDLYRYNRYYELSNKLNERLVGLGRNEINVFNKELLEMYNKVQVELTQFAGGLFEYSVVDPNRAQEVINSIWCADGKNWSDRIWTHKDQLRETLMEGLMDCVNRGTGSDALANTLLQRFDVSYGQAKTLARTELSRVEVQSQVDKYKSAGVEMVMFSAVMDDRTSEICQEMNGKIFPINSLAVGENEPPLHPNCRSTVVPIF